MSKESKNPIDNKYRIKPTPSSTAALARMKAAKPRDTAPEKALRSALFTKGLRFRLDKKPVEDLNRKADILFISAKVAVFVDGCYWHGCPIHGTQSKANADFWAQKIKRNQERDLDTTNQLEKMGWYVIRVWEHEDPEIASQRICRIVAERKKKKSKG
jgi:DNA mismatch endonuclease (patch repair protein)